LGDFSLGEARGSVKEAKGYAGQPQQAIGYFGEVCEASSQDEQASFWSALGGIFSQEA
jgi:hypothetical protein